MRAAAAISESHRDCPLAAAPNATSSGVSRETPGVHLCCRSDGADVASLQPPGHGGDSGSDPRGSWGIQSRQCWEGWEGDSVLLVLLGDVSSSAHLGGHALRSPAHCLHDPGGMRQPVSVPPRQVSPTAGESLESREGERLGEGGKASKEWKLQRCRPSLTVCDGL